MKYNRYDIITFDDNSKYIVCDAIYEGNVIYLYLVNDTDDNDIVLIKEVNDVFESIKDRNEFERIMLKIAVSNKNMINEIID